jgi:ParB family chromosome partitioning protein
MANKDLIRRAFSVTANLPSRKDAATPAPTASDEQQPATDKPIAMEARSAPASAKTGPGSMLSFMAEQSEVHQEVVQLREIVRAFEGADVTRMIDPVKIVPSKWANRDKSHFESAAFARLKDEIGNAGGNVQPIKVRPLAGSPSDAAQWEIVFGHRRHRACLELGLPVLSLVQQDLGDADLFVQMERENREREDLSAWEQGVMYLRALELGLFPSAKQMAAAIDRDMGNISRAMALAKLPEDVVRAFGSPLNLQFRWASPLRDAHQKDPERLLEVSRELATRTVKPPPAEVFALLTRPRDHTSKLETMDAEWKNSDGQRVAHLAFDRKGRGSLSFEAPLDPAQRQRLIKLVDALLELKA